MENPNPPSLEDSIAWMIRSDHGKVILTEFVQRRESAIKDLAEYETDTELRKKAAEVTVYTEFLDLFQVATGEPIS
jgi:hypothetical protein